MAFLQSHAASSGVGALLGCASGFASVTYLISTPENYLLSVVPNLADRLARFVGFSDLAEVAPWWARDAPAYWMLPITCLVLWLITLSCRPRVQYIASSALSVEQEVMRQGAVESAQMYVQRAELQTPSSKAFGKVERDLAERTAHQRTVNQTAFDLETAQTAHDEYEAFLSESLLEWRLLRFEGVCGYALGFILSYKLQVWGLLGVPLVALLVPLALFLLMVITSVLYQWVAFICSAIGSCICARPNEAASAAAYREPETGSAQGNAAAAWGLSLRSARSDASGGGCCSWLSGCFASSPSAARFWGVDLKKAAPMH